VLAYNTGAAFSLLADAGGWQRLFFSTVAVVASGVIVHLLRRHPGQKLFSLALALILGGALGNLVDRIAYGHVIDFIQVYWQDWYWPAFNVADSAITMGAGLLVWDSFRTPKESNRG
jgi:signal peptidase II